jgi:hypothetical protein
MGDSCTCHHAHGFPVFQTNAGKILDVRSSDVNWSLFCPYFSLITYYSLTFIAPIVAYYDYIHQFDNEQIDEDRQNQIVWQARLIALAVTVGLWVVMFLPIAFWKYTVI